MELNLKLKGLMQSYGENDPWTAVRHTNTRPTETAIKGMIECALGLSKAGLDDEDDAVRKTLWEHVDICIHDPVQKSIPSILVDDQTVKPLLDDMRFPCADGTTKNDLPLIKKEYVLGGCFDVTLSGDDEYIEKIKYRLQHPVYPYCFGRSCCMPSAPVVVC